MDCRIGRLTPLARGAVATVVAEGIDALQLVESRFRALSGKPVGQFPLQRIVVGHWQGTGGAPEEVVVCRRAATRLEINSHGGLAASEAILRSLEAAGATRESSDSWLEREVADPIQRAAWHALTQARTERTAAVLLDQFRGALRAKLAEIIALLRADPPNCAAATRELQRLLEKANFGLHLTIPWQVVIAGAPNVGKSSLINAILGYERSIVFDQPGTTRDVVTALTALDGWPVELTDTAGLRNATDAIEREGVHRARARIAAADLTLLVIDATDDQVPIPNAVLVVANKADLLTDAQRVGNPTSELVFTSAKTGAGIDHLISAIVRRLIPVAPQRGAAVPFSANQVAACRAALKALDRAAVDQAIAVLTAMR